MGLKPPSAASGRGDADDNDDEAQGLLPKGSLD
jgi:hypothetical protein